MRFILCFILVSAFAFAESGKKSSYTRQDYTNTYQSGANQTGSAQSHRQVLIDDYSSQTRVNENHRRQHQYQTTAPSQPSSTGTYRQGGQSQRIYYHYGDNRTKAQIQTYETKRIGLLNQVDSLYTRAEKCKTTLNQNPSMTREERRRFEREIDLVSYDIGQIGLQLGNRAFVVFHPDRKPQDVQKTSDDISDITWMISPYTYSPSYIENRMKRVNWHLSYLRELQGSMATPYAQVPARNHRDFNAEIEQDIVEIRGGLKQLRR